MAKKPRHPVPLTKARKAEAQAKGGKTFKGLPLNYPAAVEARYSDALEKAVRVMLTETAREVERVWRAHAPTVTSGLDASLASQSRILGNAMAKRFQAFFDRLGPGLAKRMAEQSERASKASLHGSLQELSGGLSLKTSVIDGRVKEITTAAVAENVALIKSIPQQYFQRIQGAVMRSITKGDGIATVLEEIAKAGQVTEKRAKLIATDQTRKVTTALNSARMDALKIEEFEWLHSGGGKEPRPLHADKLNGQIFSIKDPPVIDERTGERGLPGQLIHCRCRMRPIIRFGAGDK